MVFGGPKTRLSKLMDYENYKQITYISIHGLNLDKKQLLFY